MKNLYLRLRSFFSPLKIWFFSKKNPFKLADKDYNKNMKKSTGINWEHPGDLIEKIYWLQMYSDTKLWTKCADKYRVREYVEGKGFTSSLNELYGKWDSEKDIDWDSLPNSFVLKINNGCGNVFIVDDKTRADKGAIKKNLHQMFRIRYGDENAQLHYTYIKPCIIAEKLLVNEENPDQSLTDYKFWCLNGVPQFILVVYNRVNHNYQLGIYDLEWNDIYQKAFDKNSRHYHESHIPKPKSFDKMLEMAKALSLDFEEVRVDLYEIAGNPVFGELTFTTGYGYWTNDFYQQMGEILDLSKVKCLPTPNKPARYSLLPNLFR